MASCGARRAFTWKQTWALPPSILTERLVKPEFFSYKAVFNAFIKRSDISIIPAMKGRAQKPATGAADSPVP